MNMVSKTYSREELENMEAEELQKLVSHALRAGGTITGHGVVRTKEGRIKYDDPTLKGSYHEG